MPRELQGGVHRARGVDQLLTWTRERSVQLREVEGDLRTATWNRQPNHGRRPYRVFRPRHFEGRLSLQNEVGWLRAEQEGRPGCWSEREQGQGVLGRGRRRGEEVELCLQAQEG